MKCTVTVISGNRTEMIEASGSETLLDVLSRGGFAVSAPCGGNGKCGKCRVRAEGAVRTDDDGMCLACKTSAEGDCTVYIEEADSSVLTEAVSEQITPDAGEGCGLAVDIGTTTAAGYITDLATGRTIKTVTMLNPQRNHGADVISRLEYALKGSENAQRLKDEIDGMLKAFADGVPGIRRCVLVGNTVMMHLAGGYDAKGLSKAPFIPYYSGTHIRQNAGMKTLMGGVISGYVGADTVAAVLACGMDKKPENALMIDIGTNGEIVLRHNGRFSCCSCAAGPAFEGAHIECGTGAVTGAVDHVRDKGNGAFSISTVGGGTPKGICGSGLVDAVAFLVRNGLVSSMGRMNGNFILADGVYITPADIREVQLAKAAICAGIQILMNDAGAECGDIDRVYLAGGFGNYIDITNACEIGLFPQGLLEKITPVGNAAGAGAKMLLISEEARVRYERIRTGTAYTELSTHADFEDMFADCMLFEETD